MQWLCPLLLPAVSKSLWLRYCSCKVHPGEKTRAGFLTSKEGIIAPTLPCTLRVVCVGLLLRGASTQPA